jgi:hypothetical protein
VKIKFEQFLPLAEPYYESVLLMKIANKHMNELPVYNKSVCVTTKNNTIFILNDLISHIYDLFVTWASEK